MAIDRTSLRRSATVSDQGDHAIVSRRWLAEVDRELAELDALRAAAPAALAGSPAQRARA